MSLAARAAVLTAFQQPLTIQEFPVPSSLETGAARVRVTTAGICGTDVHLWRGELPLQLPLILGHETAGVLEQAGPGLTKDWRGKALRAGDRVTWASSISCGECFYCRFKAQPTRCVSRKAYGISYPSTESPYLRGGYAEQILLRPGTALFRLPDQLSEDALIGAGCALTTAIHGLERAPLAWRDTVVVQGTGPVGLAAIALCRDAGASRIIAIGGPNHRLQLARDFGADMVIDIDDVQQVDERLRMVRAETGGFGADMVIECVGRPEAVNESVELGRDGATVLVLGQYGNAGNIAFNPHTVTRKQLRIIGSWGFEPRHVARAIDFLCGQWGADVRSRDHSPVSVRERECSPGNCTRAARRKDGAAALKRAWVWILVLVVILISALVLRKQEPPQVAFARVVRGTIVSNLPTNGKVEPVEWESVRAETAGLISSVPVREGQKVSAGAIIARLSQPGAAQELAGASARAAQSRSALETLHHGGQSEQMAELDAGIAKARFDREVADRDFHTLSRLVEKQAATSFEVLSAKQRLDAADLAIKTLTLRRQALVSPNDIAGGRARLAEAEADRQSAEVKLGTGIVVSRIPGTVYSLPARPGNYVNAGDLLANIGNLDQLRVKVFVDEPELGRIKVGLPVRITWDGLPTRVWEGAIERMPTEIVSLGSRQVGEVWATIANQQHDLVPGTTVNAEVRTDVAQNALLVPKTALRRDRGPVGVYVRRDGRLAWQAIATGTSDVSNTAVTKGLKEGELVMLPTDLPVKEGDRVRALIQ